MVRVDKARDRDRPIRKVTGEGRIIRSKVAVAYLAIRVDGDPAATKDADLAISRVADDPEILRRQNDKSCVAIFSAARS